MNITKRDVLELRRRLKKTECTFSRMCGCYVNSGKQVVLKLDGAQGELDRNVLERMTAPLEHMLRNSVAHGIESPARREKVGKSAEGAISVAIRPEGAKTMARPETARPRKVNPARKTAAARFENGWEASCVIASSCRFR